MSEAEGTGQLRLAPEPLESSVATELPKVHVSPLGAGREASPSRRTGWCGPRPPAGAAGLHAEAAASLRSASALSAASVRGGGRSLHLQVAPQRVAGAPGPAHTCLLEAAVQATPPQTCPGSGRSICTGRPSAGHHVPAAPGAVSTVLASQVLPHIRGDSFPN